MRAGAAAVALSTALLASGAARPAEAQSLPTLQLQADGPVGVGDIVHLQLSATNASAPPSDARPGPTKGFRVRSRSNDMPSEQHVFMNGSRTDSYGLTVVWSLEAERVGTFRVGPASVVVGGARYASSPLTITVLAAGQAPRRQQAPPGLPPGFANPFGPSPFDMWKGLMQGFDNDTSPSPPEPEVPIDPALGLPEPRGAYVFLHAVVDKTSAVVGEQVTLTIYEYADLSVRAALEDMRDATVADFAKHPLFREDQPAQNAGLAAIGGRTWEVKVLQRWALFPLRTGDLAIGPMRLTLVPQSGIGNPLRDSETLHVHVTEAPVARRPPGYAQGDVGRFALAAQVSPRQIEQDGAVAVHVEVSGTGNIPGTLNPPVREGVEWLPPQVRDELGATAHDAFGGKRVFDFVVRLRRAGDVDLGELDLPFWDPDARRYGVARAGLGSVRVSPSSKAAATADDRHDDTLAGLPPPRDRFEGSPAARAHVDGSPVFWLAGVGAWPLAFGVAVAGRAVGRRASGAWRRRRQSPATKLRETIAAARAACEAGDARSTDAAIARALEAATVAHTGVSVRGALGAEVVERLQRAGVAREAASSVADLLRECETARFAPEAVDQAAARDRWERAQGAIRVLEKGG